MSNAILVPTHFTALPNEIALIIFMHLTHAETIKSFGSLKCQRYKRLLQTYCYKSIDFYTTTFSTFQLCCTQMLNQFRLNVQILKLGHRDCYSQLRIFSRYCLSSSSLLDVFPQLQTLVLRNVHDSDVNDLVPYLPTIPFIDKIILNECPLNKASILICRYLLNNSLNNRLTSCTLNSTKYWLTMHIGCYHDRKHNLYIMFTLPYVHNLGFVVSNDIIHTHFNHTDDRLDYLISMLYMKAPRIDILTGVNKSLSGTFLRMLKQGWHRGKSIRIIPYGIYHLEHNNDHNLMPFDTLEIIGCYRNQSIDINLFVVDGFINTTITWLNWMPHIRILNIDNERLLHLCINNININRFLSLELLIIHQINNSQLYEALSIISSLGSSSSLHTIHLQQYGSNYQFTADDLLLILNQIRHNLSGLKIMTIEFHKDAIFNIEILDKLTDIQKKNCHLEYIHISNAYIELWFH
ncbi:unnamed protein product [Adineta steineri]|uniref:Uncharacterized protein n=1 Tax=Adineta steineri TaxID=433720 RepID=A0A813YW48_9BILA|nr:unnamed protein product [Adineta steineri]